MAKLSVPLRNKDMKLISKNPAETKRAAKKFGFNLLETKFPKATVVALQGELGAGKTTFIQGLAQGLGVKEKVKSPTFILMRQHALSRNKKFKNFYHLDCYRLRNEKDLEHLDMESILDNPDNLVVIEWAERVSKILPKKLILVHIDHIDEKSRRITISGI